MVNPISFPQPVMPADAVRLDRSQGGGDAFRGMLDQAIGRVERSSAAAAQTVEKFLGGENVELHSAAMAVQRAELELELFLQMRNKVVQAYQEIMRMQV